MCPSRAFCPSLFLSCLFSSGASSLCSESCNHFFLSPSSTCCRARKLPLYRPRPNSAIRWVATEKQSKEWIRNSLMIIELSMSDPWITVIQGLWSRCWSTLFGQQAVQRRHSDELIIKTAHKKSQQQWQFTGKDGYKKNDTDSWCHRFKEKCQKEGDSD